MIRVILPAGLAAALLACGTPCEPEPDISVTLSPVSEDVRTLPILASGATRLLGLDVPDAHGDVSFRMDVTEVGSVTVESLNFEQALDGRDLDIRRIRSQHNDKDFEDRGTAYDEGTFRFHWRMRQLSQYALEEAKAHRAKVTMNWKYVGCRTQTGVATAEAMGLSKAAVSAQNLSLETAEVGPPDILNGPKARFRLRSKSGDDITDIGTPQFSVTWFGDGTVPSIGLGTAGDGQVAAQANGMPATSFHSTGALDVFTSRGPQANDAVWEPAGLAASTGALSGGGKALVTLTIQSRGETQPTPVVDSISALVDY